MSAIAARKAARLQSEQTETPAPTPPPAPVPAPRTYAKKAKPKPKSRSRTRDPTPQPAPDHNLLEHGTPPHPLDRVVVQIDIVDRPDPIPDADSDASDFDLVEASGILSSTGRPRKKRRVETDAQPVSSYTPVQGVNIHRLSADDVQRALPDLPRKRAVLVLLEPEQTIVLSGTASLTPIHGRLSLFSSTLAPTERPTSHPIYAPLTHPLPTLSPSPTLPSHPSHLARIANLPTPMREPSPTAALFLLQELDSGIDSMPGPAVGVHRVWPDNDQGKSAVGLNGVFPILGATLAPVYRYFTPPSWAHALERIAASPEDDADAEDEDDPVDRSAPFIMIVKGAKRSGKSTFAREAVNRLLEKYDRVAYLDTDLGQSEFGVGGSVGLYILDRPLFGPAFSHPTTPLRSHFIGALNPRLSSDHYLACISHLIDVYRYDVQYPIHAPADSPKISEVVPLVINTQGWVKGLGADLLLEIERLAEPTHTYTFAEVEDPASAHGEDYTADVDAQLRTGFGTVCQLEPIPASPLLSRFTASDMRTLSTISTLHAHMTDPRVFWDFSSPLASHAPWQVTLDSVFHELYITGEGSDGIITDDLPLALNGRLVALVERTDGTPPTPLYHPGRALPPPTETHCLGIALIRSISPDGRTVHLLTPLPAAHLARASIMICGELELPVCGMLDWRNPAATPVTSTALFGVPWDEVPFLADGRDQGVGMARRKWRRNIMRRGQA